MDNSVDTYINKQNSPQKEICQNLRELIHKTIPGIKEEMKWGVPAFSDGKFYIVALKDHVNIGFSTKDLTEEELSLFDGINKTTARLEIRDMNLDKDRITGLLRLVAGKI